MPQTGERLAPQVSAFYGVHSRRSGHIRSSMRCGPMEFRETRWTSCKRQFLSCELNLTSRHSYVDEAQDNLLVDALGTFSFGVSP